MTTAPKLPEGFQALRDATAAVLAPIGNMTDRHTAVLRTMERRLAFQQACGPYTIDALLHALCDAQAALQAQAAEKDAEIAFLKLQLEAGPLYSTRLKARRYDLLRRGQQWSVINGIGDTLRAEELDAAIDSALALAAKEAK